MENEDWEATLGFHFEVEVRNIVELCRALQISKRTRGSLLKVLLNFEYNIIQYNIIIHIIIYIHIRHVASLAAPSSRALSRTRAEKVKGSKSKAFQDDNDDDDR